MCELKRKVTVIDYESEIEAFAAFENYASVNILKEQYDAAAVELGALCSKHLAKGWDIYIENLVIYKDHATGKYKNKPVEIRFVEDRQRHTGELVLSFCCDDIPLLHTPFRMLVTDGSIIRVAYYKMFSAYEEYAYQNNLISK